MKDYRIYADRAEYLKHAVSQRRKNLRKKAIEYKGNKCNICGYNRCYNALEFHHIKENQKEFGLSARGLTRAWSKITKELDKCILICANCHREMHAGILQLPAEMLVETQGELREP